MQEIIVYIIIAVAVFFAVKRLVAKDNKCGCGCDKCDCHGCDKCSECKK
ncbi:MAG: FeoB-associated Cys-rich membrane protein [Bacteroidales bacterium]|nr:FeoB-associated Cys-rich membrane protein [Bacteroidales bacterium]